MRARAVESPAIYISPDWAHTADPASAIGTNYTISVYTDYTGDDVWGYEFTLTYNANVLAGVEVVNGDLITEDVATTMPFVGEFNDTLGMLDLTGNSFYVSDPASVPVTSGPGTLANVTFEVVGYGISNITLGDETILIGYDDILEEEFIIIDETTPDPGHMGDGFFKNIILGDIQGDTPGTPPDGDCDRYDFFAFLDHYGSSIGDPNYNILADLQGDTPGTLPDGDVDRYDFFTFLDNYGRSYP